MKKLALLTPALVSLGLFACSSEDGGSSNSSDGGATNSSGGSASGSGGAGIGEGGADNGTGGSDVGNASSECDLTGTWVIEAKTYTTGGGGTQEATRWYLYEIEQSGTAITVKSSLNCAMDVISTSGIGVHVSISDDALAGILDHNSHAGVKGTYSEQDGMCALDFERVYNVRGADKSLYLPSDPSARPELADLPALPTKSAQTGAEDWDGDGKLGLAFSVESLISGTRNSAQRDYIEFQSDAAHTIDLNSTSFTVINATSIEESVIDANVFLSTVATLDSSKTHTAKFTRIGDTRATAKLPGDADIPGDDVAACRAIEAAYPNN